MLTTYPDSVYLLLDSLVNENDLDEACFAKSCLLISKAADKINGKLLSIADYEKSIAWYNSNGEEADRAQILFIWDVLIRRKCNMKKL